MAVDLRKGAITVDGSPLVLSGGQLAAYLHILVATARGEDDVSSVDQERLRQFLDTLPKGALWASKVRSWVREPDPVDADGLHERCARLQQTYSRMRQTLRKRLKRIIPGREPWLVPESVTQGGQTTQRLSQPPDRINVAPDDDG